MSCVWFILCFNVYAVSRLWRSHSDSCVRRKWIYILTVVLLSLESREWKALWKEEKADWRDAAVAMVLAQLIHMVKERRETNVKWFIYESYHPFFTVVKLIHSRGFLWLSLPKSCICIFNQCIFVLSPMWYNWWSSIMLIISQCNSFCYFAVYSWITGAMWCFSCNKWKISKWLWDIIRSSG